MMQIRDDRSLGELFVELTKETTTLVRQEVQLAKTEMRQKATEAGTDVAFLGTGGALEAQLQLGRSRQGPRGCRPIASG